MQIGRTVLVFLSGSAVYALMAACTGSTDVVPASSGAGVSASSSSSSGAGGGTTSGGGHGGASSSSSGGVGGAGGKGGSTSSSSGGGTGGTSSPSSTSSSGSGGAGGSSSSSSGSGGASASSSASSSSSGGGGGKTTSGARLKRMFALGDDGTTDLDITWIPWMTPNGGNYDLLKPVTQWWDSQRQENCAFQRAADGKMRCLPLEPGNMIVFFDGACKQPAMTVLAAPPGCPQAIPKYFMSYDTPACNVTEGMPAIHVSSVGAYIGSAMCYWGGPSCTAGCTNQPLVFYSVGPEIDPVNFVAGSPAMDP